jgi:hypothetical protein
MAGTEYRNVGDHVEDLASGQTIGPGETVTLSKADLDAPHNQRLLDDGKLMPTKAKKEEGGS